MNKFIYIEETKKLNDFFGTVIKYITVYIDGKKVFSRDVAGDECDVGKKIVKEGNAYKEFLEATGTKNENNYRFINATNNAYSSHFGVRGWNYSPKYGELPNVLFSDFL